MTDAPELKPCPFCGSKKASVLPCNGKRIMEHRIYPIVRCGGCYLDLPGANDDFSETGKSAIDAWNTRADLLPQWQPIETAPDDGRAFMVYIPQFNNGPLVLSYISQDANGRWWDDATGYQIEVPEATHWMPTLAPPTE